MLSNIIYSLITHYSLIISINTIFSYVFSGKSQHTVEKNQSTITEKYPDHLTRKDKFTGITFLLGIWKVEYHPVDVSRCEAQWRTYTLSSLLKNGYYGKIQLRKNKIFLMKKIKA